MINLTSHGLLLTAHSKNIMKNAAEYADIIIRDERNKIKTETPTVYTAEKIERIYEFHDGAIIKYEWQSAPDDRTSAEHYNHQFSLINLPEPNLHKFKKGIVKVINYPHE
jgi:hypothetical protein